MFTRLTKDEEIPQLERVRAAPLRWAASARRRVRGGRWHDGRGRGRTGRWQLRALRQHLGAIVFIPAAAAALISMVFVLGRGQPVPSCLADSAAHLQSGQRAYSQSGLRAYSRRSWGVPSCLPASISGTSAYGRLPAVR